MFVLVLRCVLDAVSGLLLKQHLMFLVWAKWTCGEVELCQILVSEVELGSGLMVGFFSVLWFLRWTMVC